MEILQTSQCEHCGIQLLPVNETTLKTIAGNLLTIECEFPYMLAVKCHFCGYTTKFLRNLNIYSSLDKEEVVSPIIKAEPVCKPTSLPSETKPRRITRKKTVTRGKQSQRTRTQNRSRSL